MNWWILLVAAIVAGIFLAAYLVIARRPNASSPSPSAVVSHRRRAVATDTGIELPGKETTTKEKPAVDRSLPPALEAFWLAEEHEIPPEQHERITERLGRVVIPPRGVQRFVSTDILAGSAARELAELVMSEPRLAAKVLGRVNSPFYGLQTPIASVPHAITYLGMNAVRSMALSFLLEESFTTNDPELQHYYDDVWTAGLFASELCSLLAGKLGLGDSGALCTQTVLSFLGELAAPALLGNRALEIRHLGLLERLRFEQENIGASSVLLGTIMMQGWGLPASIIEAVAASGRVISTPAAHLPLELAVRAGLGYTCARLGEAIARQQIERAEQIDLLSGDTPELFYLQEYLRLPPLASIPGLLATPDIHLCLMRMLTTARNDMETTPIQAHK